MSIHPEMLTVAHWALLASPMTLILDANGAKLTELVVGLEVLQSLVKIPTLDSISANWVFWHGCMVG
jgi:hypothetical protein